VLLVRPARAARDRPVRERSWLDQDVFGLHQRDRAGAGAAARQARGMMRGFIWTAARDRQLRDMRHEGRSPAEIARVLGCDVEHVNARSGHQLAQTRRASADVAIVPRPVAVRHPGLIDISKAPSALETPFSAKRP
jgi:hypothetical protein